MLQGKKLINSLNVLINSDFNTLIQKLGKIPEVRKQKSYEIKDVLSGALALFILKCESRNCYNNLRNNPAFGDNYEQAFNVKLPHGDTIERVLRSSDPKLLEDIKAQEVTRLIRKKIFKQHRLHGEYYTVAIDATGMCSYKQRHCPHCLHKTSKKGKTTYFHYVLEAKLVSSDGHAISIASEFVENPDGEEYVKQDCELKAFQRLATKIKNYFPRLPICLLLDGLYPNKNVFETCNQNSWAFIVTLKESSLKTFQRQVDKVSTNTAHTELNQGNWKVKRDYRYVNGLTYAKQKYAYIECIEKKSHPCKEKEDSIKKFAFITNLNQDASSIQITLAIGRLRWKIENEGFNIQKNNGYGLKHKYSRNNYLAMQNYYHLMQLAHMITQFVIRMPQIKTILQQGTKLTEKSLWGDMKSILTILKLNMTQLE